MRSSRCCSANAARTRFPNTTSRTTGTTRMNLRLVPLLLVLSPAACSKSEAPAAAADAPAGTRTRPPPRTPTTPPPRLRRAWTRNPRRSSPTRRRSPPAARRRSKASITPRSRTASRSIRPTAGGSGRGVRYVCPACNSFQPVMRARGSQAARERALHLRAGAVRRHLGPLRARLLRLRFDGTWCRAPMTCFTTRSTSTRP